jgi:hypothetical protein
MHIHTQVIRGDQNGVVGLTGAYAVAVSPTHVYVSGWTDQSVCSFRRNWDGSLIYVDFLRNGERVISTFDDSAPAAGGNKYPTRLGSAQGGAGAPQWASTARDSTAFSANGRKMVAVAHSDVGKGSSGAQGTGTLALYEHTLAGEFVLLDTTAADPQAARLEYFYMEGYGHFIAVANNNGFLHGSDAGKGVNVYKLQGTKLELYQSLLLGMHCSAVEYFEHAGYHYLAVATMRCGSSFSCESNLYRYVFIPPVC